MRMRNLLLCLSAALVACSEDAGPRSTLTPDQAQQMRSACAFKSGTLPGLSLAKDAPLGPQIPIDTVVIVMMENRSFDHLLGNLPATGQPAADVADPNATQLDPNGVPVRRFHQTEHCFADTNHGWDAVHKQLNGGALDGFVVSNGPPYDTADKTTDGVRAMGYYDETDVPWLYGLANAYAISDRYFSSVLGPTFPNRDYLYAATSYGTTTNRVFASGGNANIVTLLEGHNAMPGARPVSWRIYDESIPNLAIFLETLSMYLDSVFKIDRFYADAAAGTLPNVVFVDPDTLNESGAGDDFHPPGTPQKADQFLAKVVDAVTHSPQWPHLALFITFDEHGGLYDHVLPPKACAPDEIAPILGNPTDTPYDFANYGFRVPLFVVSPYAKPHYVSHVVGDHTSILRFVESRFQLPAMTARDANADPLFDMFDFSTAALKTPAPLPPVEQIDQAVLDACAQKFPNHPPDLGMGGPADAGTH